MQNVKDFFKGSRVSAPLECSSQPYMRNITILFHLNDDRISVIVPGVIFVVVALLSGYITENYNG